MKAVAYLAAADMSLLRYVVVNKVVADGTVLPCRHVSATASWAKSQRAVGGALSAESIPFQSAVHQMVRCHAFQYRGIEQALPLYHSKVE